MSTGLQERCVSSHPGITFVTWNTCGSVDIGIAMLLERMSQVSSWSFVAIQEYGSGAELRGHRLLYQPCAGGRRSLAIILHEDEAKSFVGVGYSKHAVVVELRQYVAVSLHLPHSRSSDTEYIEACQEVSRMITTARGIQASVPWNDSNAEFACPS